MDMYGFKSSTSACSVVSEPSCSVCTEPFDDDQHLPKILQCAHTICHTCMGLLEDQGRLAAGLLQTDRNFVYMRCPTCRYLTQTPRAYVRSNYQLMDAVQSIGKIDKVSHHECISCVGKYHESDMNICSNCNPITGTSQAQELIDKNMKLDQVALCSTCLLREHVAKGHTYIPLQPLRVEMQRIENLRRIRTQHDGLHKAQRLFREKAALIESDWIQWNGAHESLLASFQNAVNTAQQKTIYDEIVKSLCFQAQQVELLTEKLEMWSEEVKKGVLSASVAAPASPNTGVPPIPPRPNYPPRPQNPLPRNNDEAGDMLYYLEYRP